MAWPVVACAKLYSDWTIILFKRASYIFYKVWIMGSQTFVKCSPSFFQLDLIAFSSHIAKQSSTCWGIDECQ